MPDCSVAISEYKHVSRYMDCPNLHVMDKRSHEMKMFRNNAVRIMQRSLSSSPRTFTSGYKSTER